MRRYLIIIFTDVFNDFTIWMMLEKLYLEKSQRWQNTNGENRNEKATKVIRKRINKDYYRKKLTLCLYHKKEKTVKTTIYAEPKIHGKGKVHC